MPYKPVTSTSVGRWIKSLPSESGINTKEVQPVRKQFQMEYLFKPFYLKAIGPKSRPLPVITTVKLWITS